MRPTTEARHAADAGVSFGDKTDLAERAAEADQTPRPKLRLLGSFELLDAEGRAVRLNTRKAEALLAYLALHTDQPQTRERVCALLWPDVRDAQARHSLRQTLLQLRKSLSALPVGLVSDARGLQLSASQLAIDTLELQGWLSQGSREALIIAGELYRGELLSGLSVGEAPFEQWLGVERKRVRELMVEGLTRLSALDSESNRLDEAIQSCSRLIELDPLREQAHRNLMQLLVRQGRRSAALGHYRGFASTLRNKYGLRPDPVTEQLYAELERESGVDATEPRASSIRLTAAASLSEATTTGRGHELSLLFQALLGASQLRPSVNLIVGEAGVGKTHLCDRAVQRAQADGFRVLRARCFESEQVLPFAPWASLLRDAISPELPLTPEQRSELAALVPELTAEEPTRTSDARRLFQSVHEVLRVLAAQAPLLILLEDIHWADEMSARLLSYVGRHLRTTCSLLLLSAREEDMPEGAFVHAALAELSHEQQLARIELSPLTRDETDGLTTQLAQEQALAPLDPALFDQIWNISQGNPLVIVESIRALACGGLARDVTQLPVPERVRSLIISRVSKVSAHAREVLALAAVAGRELELDVLVGALDGVPLTAALDELARTQLVRAMDERVYFTHDRIRETLYSEMLPVSRRILHGRVARALEARGDERPAAFGHIGYHYSKAGNAAASVRYLRRFAELAVRDHAFTEASAALEQAFLDSQKLPAPDCDTAAVEIVIRQASCMIALGRFVDLVARLEALAPRMHSLALPQLAGQFHFFWGFALALLAERREAETHAERALHHATYCNDRRVIGFTHALLSYLCQMTGRYDAGISHGMLATELLEGEKDSAEAATIAWLCLGLNRLWLGDAEAALQATERGAAIATAADRMRGQALAATAASCVHAYTDQWTLALEATQRSLHASKEPFTMVSALWMMAWAQSGSGQRAEAIELLTQVIDQLTLHGMRAWCAHAMTIMADALLQAGDAPRALQRAREAFDIATATDDRACAGWAMRAQGQALSALGELTRARERLDDAVVVFEALRARIDIAKTLVERAELALKEGHPEPAREDLRRAHALFSECGVGAPLARVALLEERCEHTHAPAHIDS